MLECEMPKFFRLHLELDCRGADKSVLRKWGKVDKAISRDVLVLSSMPLHSLHFVIQRAFGWENSHLHHFRFPDKVFSSLTSDNFLKWSELCGIYFRFPTSDFEDVYWYNDFQDDMDFGKWLQSKYEPPYYYNGHCELYPTSRQAVLDFIDQNPTFERRSEVFDFESGKSLGKVFDIEDAGVLDFPFFDCTSVFELIEHRALDEYLCLKKDRKWKSDLEKVKQLSLEGYERWDREIPAMAEWADRIQKDLGKSGMKGLIARQELDEFNYRSMMLLEGSQIPAVPVSDKLVYEYDYGDSWRVNITLADVLDVDWEDMRILNPGYEGSCDLVKRIYYHGAFCIASDGLPVMDDVGGLGGYCDFLKELHGDVDDPEFAMFPSSSEARQWARDRGWSGRSKRPENIL